MSWDKVTSGQKLRQTPIHRAGFINDTIDVVNAYKEGRIGRPAGVGDRDETGNRVYVRNLTGSDRALGQVLQLGNLLLTDVKREHPWFEGNLFAGTLSRRFAVLMRPLKAGEIGPAQIAGICPASVLVVHAAHTHAYPIAGSAVLRSTPAGPVELLTAPSGPGVRLLWVKLDHKENRCYHVTLNSGIAPLASATVLLSDGRFVSATNWSTDTTLLSGDKCLCFEDLVDNIYYLVKSGGQPKTKIWHSTAVDDIDAGATATVELSDATEVEATNWSDGLDIKADDKVHVYQDPTDSSYYAIKSARNGSRWFKATLSGTLESTDSSASVGSVVALDGGDSPSVTTVSNWLHKAGTNGSDVAIVEDLSGEEPAYLLMDVLHKAVKVDIDVEVDDEEDPTLLRQWKRTICVMTGNDDTSPEDVIELQDVEVDINVKTDSGGSPTKLQQTKRTIKSFPKPDDSADSDIIGIESC
jgi:hypothetical protein